MTGKFVFKGDFWEYFFISILQFILCAFTFGLAFPYWIYWSVKYFSKHIEIKIDSEEK